VSLREDALEYHATGRKGKVEVIPTKPCRTQRDLSLAYTPGVAQPCLEIEKDPDTAYEYTARGNLVAVISNGTATLGLGDIGALACKPVMEGKGVLFKRFADVDVFDIEVDTRDTDELIKVCQLLEPTFGGINLEDIKAPECFIVEDKLKETMNIPIFHDDQHGTAIISAAGLLNALEIGNKDIADVRVVFLGAGASAIACAKLYENFGVKHENIFMADSKGLLYEGREGMNPWKQYFATKSGVKDFSQAMDGADVFVGLSKKDALTNEDFRRMAPNPIVFAMANPDPEITPERAATVRTDHIMATGRSDYPNQVNNVLGFPFIFRGALDVRSKAITEGMKMAASRALADLAKEDVPDAVSRAYGKDRLEFGPDYIIPKPFDHRVLIWEASAVAKAASDDGVARFPVEDLDEYKYQLERRLGKGREVVRLMISKAKDYKKRIVFPEGDHEKILRAAHAVLDAGIADPVLIARRNDVEQLAEKLHMSLEGIEVVHPVTFDRMDEYVKEFVKIRGRKGVTPAEARYLLRIRTYFAAMMVHMGDADGMVAGVSMHYPDTIRPALQTLGTAEDVRIASGVYAMIVKDKLYFFSDATVNIQPDAEDLAEIAVSVADLAREFGETPRVAMLSFSNFGSTKHPRAEKVRKAVEILKRDHPDLVVDGEMQADTAVNPELAGEYPFSAIKGDANVLIFPDLQSANTAYKLMMQLGGATAIGPILMGTSKPAHVLQRGCSVDDVVNMTAICVVDAQMKAGETAHPEADKLREASR
jgi:malate dehydrogenase (oxaloacetate-decarboxylating)(NADP+)